MHRRIAHPLFFALFIAWSFSAFAQTEFSAEVAQDNRPNNLTKIFVSKDKMRFEASDRPNGQTGAYIVDLSSHTSMVIMDQQRMYMEIPTQMVEKRGLYSFFQAGDVENACSDWAKMPRNQGGTCHKIGHESVNGRDTVKYEGTNSQGENGTVWIDPKLRFPVKWQEKNGGGELKNIKEGSQPASLFEVPAGYSKMDMGGMMRQKPQ